MMRRATKRARARSGGYWGWVAVWLGLGIWVSGSAVGWGAEAEALPDQLAFEAAQRAFEDGEYDRAAREFQEFTLKFSGSTRLREAQERWLLAKGEAGLRRKSFREAREAFASCVAQFPESPRAVYALVGEALGWMGEAQPQRALEAMSGGGGRFERAVAAGAPARALFRGLMLRGRAFFALGQHGAGVRAVELAQRFQSSPEDEWQRLRLLAQIQMASTNGVAAFEAAGRLRALGTNGISLERRAEANALFAQLLEQRGEKGRASGVWEENLSTNLPLETRREAVLRVAAYEAESGKATQARERLAQFLSTTAGDAEVDRVFLQEGQIALRQYRERLGTNGAPTAEAVSYLEQAAGYFDRVITNHAGSATWPHAQLGRGWCHWEEYQALRQTNRLADAVTSFQAAAMRLTNAYAQATARMKLADCLALQRQHALALTNYVAVAEGYPDDEAAAARYREPAWGQAALLASELGDTNVAVRATFEVVRLNPIGARAQDAARAVGALLARVAPSDAFDTFFRRLMGMRPDMPSRAELQLTLASVFMREGRWTNALSLQNDWLSRYSNHLAASQVWFDRARVASALGVETNSVAWFAQLAAQFPTNREALKAQLWLGSHYQEQGDLVKSESLYRDVVYNPSWRGLDDWYLAHLLASRAALARRTESSPDNARHYLTNLINSAAGRSNLLAHAYFALGDTMRQKGTGDRLNQLTNFSEAIVAYRWVERFASAEDPLVAAASGAIGDCHFQLGALNRANYSAAADAYRFVAESVSAPVAIRSKALVGLGLVAERLDQADQALGYYQDVLYGKHLRPGEVLDPIWTRESAMAAAKLRELRGEWREAERVYRRLALIFPQLTESLEPRINRALQQQLNANRAQSTVP